MTGFKFHVRARAELLIDAAPDEVWRVLTDFAAWPQWNEGMDSQRLVELSQPIAPGGRFAWRAKGITLTGVFARVEPPRLIRWVGRGPGLRALHTYRLEQAGGPAGRTLVRADEELAGWLVGLLRPRFASLAYAGLPKHLQGLKRASEHNPVLSPKG